MNILAIIFPLVAVVGGAIALAFINKNNAKTSAPVPEKSKHTKPNKNKTLPEITAQEFVNVKDITDKYLYTRDGLVFTYVRIYPISPDLLSRREKRTLTRQLTAEISAEPFKFGFMALSRPVDISPLIKEYSELLSESNDPIQKEILKNEMQAMSNYALSGEVVERQFYIKIWEKYSEGSENDLQKRAFSILGYFTAVSINGEILKEDDIVRLSNLITNPAYVHIESTNIRAAMPIIESLIAAGREE
ncbi:hypothetical protein [Ruminiclostridium cellobioparum]|uniref:Uncharacterized protein n=1 Tax=Ruminiclostridium cellobioparum subsp. termitidis CT1112 TaxID=1195236 RepID=S0FK84_RUMCE|nr:hypothetical protein [Ruminiclostridium cellobioparum]EMS72237.1 hypothetical protein CTER_1730 [Ruminiclostridium cellobioparum subsp. termitidis CT1112]